MIRFIPFPAHLRRSRSDNLAAPSPPFRLVHLELLNRRVVPPQAQVYTPHIVSQTALKKAAVARLQSGGRGERQIPSFHFRSPR